MRKIQYICAFCKGNKMHKVDVYGQKWDEDIQVWYPTPNVYDFTFFHCEECSESTEDEPLEVEIGIIDN